MQRAEVNNFRKSHIAISGLTYTERLWLELQAPSLQRDWAAVAKEVDLPFGDPVQCDGPSPLLNFLVEKQADHHQDRIANYAKIAGEANFEG